METHLPPPATPDREREIFLACLEFAPDETRRRFLAEACGNDLPLRQSVESLLLHHQADDFLERPAVAVTRPFTPPPGIGPVLGSSIGPYRLISELGAGGCGIVFEADQETPMRRRVALKLIKPGMDSRAVIARFEVERQALALLEHPHIARVLDAGTTSAGQPFFVMEFVGGASITRFCDEERLELPDRLRLFLRVAAAMEHAHGRGIIHRDLKPSNILVTRQDGKPWPRIIDFGVAKALGPQLTSHSTFTVPGFFLGTPAYMSPEQADLRAGAVDRRTDVYSLGALLYELLVGMPPFDPQRLVADGLDAMRRIIREQDPEPPSVALQQQPVEVREAVAARRGVTPGRLVRELRGEADWIALKALEKEPDRRYDSVAELAADVRRMLDNEPVLARPPGGVYRLHKLIRRRPVIFATVAAFLLPLMLGAGLTLWQAQEKTDALEKFAFAEREEQLQRERFERVRDDEARLRQETELLGQAARRRGYANDLNFVQQALAADNLGRASKLLEAQRPDSSQTDLRGWEWRYLWQLCRSEALFTLGRAMNDVRSLSLSADGERLAVVEANDEVTVWSISERRLLARLPPVGRFQRVIFSPTEPLLAYAVESRGRGTPGEVLLWNADVNREVTRFKLAGTAVGMAFSRDGRQLLTATPEGELERWSVATLRRVGRTAAGPIRPQGSGFAVNEDLSRAAWIGPDDLLALHDTRIGARLWQSAAAVRDVWQLVMSPDGGTLAATAGPRGDGALRRWSVADGRELPALTGHTAWAADVAFLGDGARLVSAGADQTVRIWSAADGALLRTLRGHRAEVWGLGVSADGARLVTGAKDGELNVWDLNRAPAAAPVVQLPGNIRAWSFSGTDGTLVTLDDQGRVRRWRDGQTNAPVELFETGPTRFGGVLSSDAALLAHGTRNGPIAVWGVNSGEKLAEIGSAAEFRVPVALLVGSTNLISFQPRERTYTRWSLPGAVPLETWPVNQGLRGFNSQAVAEPAGRPALFGSITADGQMDLRALGTGRTDAIELGFRQVNGASFSPDGTRLAVSSGRGRAALWELNPPRRLAELGGFLLGTHGVTFSPAGDRLAVTSLGREAIKLFDVAGETELLTLGVEGSQMLNTVRFSPDGRWLGASGPDGHLWLWRAPDWEEIAAAEPASR
jgi:serine/threonine protein kinase/WD40 repeat protein